jgi:hypothetical protein
MKSFKYGANVEFKDTGWTAFVRGLDQIDKRAVKVGFLVTSQIPIKEGKSTAPELVKIAAANEFGAPHAGRGGKTKIPARPFIRPTADAKRTFFHEKQKEYLQAIIQGLVRNGRAMNVNQALTEMGEKMAGFVEQAIIDMKSPPNAYSTQLAKGRKLKSSKGVKTHFLGGAIFATKMRRGKQVMVKPPLVDNPLVDYGQMAGSVRWAVTTDLKGGI